MKTAKVIDVNGNVIGKDYADQVHITSDLSSCTEHKYESLVEVVVTRDDGKQAKAFLSMKRTDKGISFELITKKKNAHDETRVAALATFFEPVRIKGKVV